MALLAGVVALAGAGCTGSSRLAAAAGEGTVAAAEGMSVTGTGRVRGTPDMLRATVGVEVTRPTVQEAMDAAAAAAEQVLAALREAGIGAEDIQTREFAVEPRYHYPQDDRPPQITGYVVRNLVEARVRDLQRVGAVLDGAVRAGGDDARLYGVSFSLEDNEELLDAARTAAYEDARAKAERYAEVAGVALGRLVSLQETDAQPPSPVFHDSEAARDAPIEPGSQEVSVRVTARWELR
jgi:hypothetical protein